MGMSERDIMGSPYLNNDESIILSTHDVIINSVPAEMILTSHRLMLVDTTHKKILPQDIPFSAIETVTIGENSGNNPVLALSVATPDGTRQPLAVVFPVQVRAKREGERDEWAARLKEFCVSVQQTSGIVPLDLAPPWVPGLIPEGSEEDTGAEVVRPGTRFKGLPLSQRKNRAGNSSKTRLVIAAAAVIVIIIAVIFAITWYAPPLTGSASLPPAPTPTPAITAGSTPIPTTVPTVVPTPTITATPAPTASETPKPFSLIPQNGVWVRVKYDGNYTGEVGAPGRFKIVSASGNQFFQIPAKDETVAATIQKGDNSGNPLTIEFYNNGELVKTGTVTAPKGTLTINVNLKTITATVTPTQSPVVSATPSS
jgi:hypothetical protein